MSTQNSSPTSDQDRVVKGKSPRNALVAVGAIFAVLIGAMGYYYQSKASDKAEQQAKDDKAAKAAASVDHGPSGNDIDRIISDQQAAARRDEERARKAAAAGASAPQTASSKPALSLDQFEAGSRTADLSAGAKEDNVYASPIFIPGVKVKAPADAQNAGGVNGILTPQQMALQQIAAQQAAAGSADAQAKVLAAAMGQGNTKTSSADRDLDFLKDAKAQSASGEGFLSAGFVGQSGSCTLSPPHHIPVLVMEGENSDRPGTAALMVEQDVYDSVTGTCLMIPKGAMITAPYQSDIKVGQESILVAATEMRLPNGKQVPLYGSEGADQNGYAGFSGDVNNHFLKIFGASFLTAILLNHFTSDTSSTTTGPLGVTQVGNTAGQVAAQTSQSILNRYQNIPPTITIKPGQRFMIKVNRDIHLEPYRG
ncbi:TrbI/VirB10 family protein [Paraburkholderia sp. CNPSo 3274]|uniref:TrbI/VirB10 family protein n=1 Tax=unclassified Paraburkholderia TaxID=2615204 RepID=UPI0020B6CFD9|nr:MULTISPECIES: TrbI/VirB10 family protein [unclassified Paraburkholderia]MCP3712590.1 TrbI/VirB10 family protein [Paraburkholderia sp. CNPSo 3274]MCP3718524.1 TrbI/VirB10 family protein [Paraburkholderia sp. CNPSo 3281]MCP3724691.1 TrbI/VirB10 family protein [Paraburkholderia sp. CNPSo 3272]